MKTYWIDFAKTVDPNGAGSPVWPKYDAKTRVYTEFKDAGPVARQNLAKAFRQLWSEFLEHKMEAVL
jgi:para-nitrobenzyl esterase